MPVVLQIISGEFPTIHRWLVMPVNPFTDIHDKSYEIIRYLPAFNYQGKLGTWVRKPTLQGKFLPVCCPVHPEPAFLIHGKYASIIGLPPPVKTGNIRFESPDECTTRLWLSMVIPPVCLSYWWLHNFLLHLFFYLLFLHHLFFYLFFLLHFCRAAGCYHQG